MTKAIRVHVGEEAPKQTYESFKAIIEAYKEQNPVKYAQKKEALEARLAALKK